MAIEVMPVGDIVTVAIGSALAGIVGNCGTGDSMPAANCRLQVRTVRKTVDWVCVRPVCASTRKDRGSTSACVMLRESSRCLQLKLRGTAASLKTTS
jgi:hypothetical protein